MAKAPTTRGGGTYSGGGNQSSKRSEDGYSQDESASWGEENSESVEEEGEAEEGEAPKPTTMKKGAAARIAEALREQDGADGTSRADDEPYTREKEDLYRGSKPGEESQSEDSWKKVDSKQAGNVKREHEGGVRDLSGL